MSILNKLVSYYSSVTSAIGGQEKNLIEILQGDEHREMIMELRAVDDETESKLMKAKLPYYTVTGVFERRCNEGLVKPSGLACVDLDSAEGYDIPALLKELKKIACIAYAGLSCRGKRLFCIVPFAYPDKYEQQYRRLAQSFNEAGLSIGDECHKAISQPRFVSWSPSEMQFFNHEATPFSLLTIERKTYTIKRQRSGVPLPEDSFERCVVYVSERKNFIEGERHSYISALAAKCNVSGIPEEEAYNRACERFAGGDFTADEIGSIYRWQYSKFSQEFGKYQFGVRPREKHEAAAPKAYPPITSKDPNPQPPDDEQEEEQLQITWSDEIEALQAYFSTATIPNHPVKLKPWETITSVSRFVESHMRTITANDGRRIYRPYIDRLHKLKEILNTGSDPLRIEPITYEN